MFLFYQTILHLTQIESMDTMDENQEVSANVTIETTNAPGQPPAIMQ